MSHIPSIVDHARVAVMTFPSPPSLPLSRPWAGWVRGYHCSRSSWFRDHQSPHLLPKFPLSHLDIWQKIWLWAFLPSILHHFLKLVKLQAFSPSCLLVCTALCECECIWVSFFFFFSSLPGSGPSLFFFFFSFPSLPDSRLFQFTFPRHHSHHTLASGCHTLCRFFCTFNVN